MKILAVFHNSRFTVAPLTTLFALKLSKGSGYGGFDERLNPLTQRWELSKCRLPKKNLQNTTQILEQYKTKIK